MSAPAKGVDFPSNTCKYVSTNDTFSDIKSNDLYVYTGHVQLQTGYGLLFSDKTTGDLLHSPIIVLPPFKHIIKQIGNKIRKPITP